MYDEDQPLAPARRRTGRAGRSRRGRTTAGGIRARPPGAQYVAPVSATRDEQRDRRPSRRRSDRAKRSDRRSAPRPPGRGRAGSRARRRERSRAHPTIPATSGSRMSRWRQWSAASPTTRHAVERAARSCSPRNDAWRLPGCCAKPTSPQRDRGRRDDDDQQRRRPRAGRWNRSGRRSRRGARRARRASPAATNAVPPFASAVDEDERGERARRDRQAPRPRADSARARRCANASATASAASTTSPRTILTDVPPSADSRARLVDGLDRARRRSRRGAGRRPDPAPP